MTKLTKEQLIIIQENIFALIDKSSTRRANLVGKNLLKRDESLEIAKKEKLLKNLAKDLNFQLLKEIVETDLTDPGEQIITATNTLKKKIDQLKAVNDFTGILAKAFNIFSTIVNAFKTGNLLSLTNLLDNI
jgi:hypothetical protein